MPARPRPLALIALLCLGNAGQDQVDQVVSALRAGVHQPAARHHAAAVLAAAGAQPADGTANVQTAWAGSGQAPLRDRALGPAYRLVELNGGEEVQFEQTFLAGQRAHVAITEAGKGRFALAISDETGQAFCRAEARDCSWLPLWTTRFHIAIRNRGHQRSRTFLVLQ